MRPLYNFIYRLHILAIAASSVGSLLWVLYSGRLVLFISIDTVIVTVGVAETIIAITLLLSA